MVDVVGKDEPEQVTEYYLSQIIEARMTQIFDRVRQDLDHGHTFETPGGLILVGGTAAMPGVVDLATKALGMNARLFVPGEMGLRNPAFAQVISVVSYVGNRSDIDVLVSQAFSGDYAYTAAEETYVAPVTTVPTQTTTVPANVENDFYVEPQARPVATQKATEPEEDKEGLMDRAKNFFGNLFD